MGLKVLFACDVLKYAAGGVKYYIHELVEHLSRYDDLELTLLAERPGELDELPARVPRVYIDFGPEAGYVRRVVNYLAVNPRHFTGYDVVHLPFSNAYLAMSWALLRRRGPRTVVTVHDLIPLVMAQYYSATIALFYRFWFPRILRRASVVLADSQYTKDDILRHFSIPADKVVVSYLGLKARFRGLEPVAEKKPFFLALSTVEPRKNFERTVRAFLRVRAGAPGWPGTLKIVGKLSFGSGPLVELAGRHPEAVELLGPVDDATLAELMRTASGLVYPSLYEGFGLPVVEAMALGCPVVTSSTTSLPEVGGDAVVYVDPADEAAIAAGIRAVAFDPDLRRRLAARGVERAKLFSWERCAADARAAYYRAAGGPRVEYRHPVPHLPDPSQ